MKIVKTAQQWIDIEALGTWERDCKNGSVHTFNGEEWYLSHLELPPRELQILMDAFNI